MGNPIRKSADVEQPWASFEHRYNDWEWRVLKAYKQGDTSRKDPAARFFCAVMSPHTYGSWEYGDVYVTDILAGPRGIELMQTTEEFEEWLAEWRGDDE